MKPKPKARPVNVASAKELLAYLDRSDRAARKGARRLDAIEESHNEIVRALNALTARLEAGSAPEPRAPSTSPASSATADVDDRVELVRAMKSAGPAGQNLMMKILLSRKPELAAKLAALGGCAAHDTFSLSCGECQQSALQGLM